MGARKQFVFYSSFLMKAESCLTLKEELLHLNNKPHTSEQGCKARAGTFLSQREESRSGGRKERGKEVKEGKGRKRKERKEGVAAAPCRSVSDQRSGVGSSRPLF